VNGDGLPDLVTKLLDNDGTDIDPNAILQGVKSTSTSVTVNLNSGAGFLPPQQWTGALPVPIQSRSSVNRDLGLHFTISFPITPVLWFITNPGFYHGDTFGGSRSQVRDLDGDGYADHISAAGAAVTVNLNKRGKTNLLKSITRPLGATITLDYTRAGNTTDLPQNHWVMSSRTIDDGVATAAADVGVVAGAAHTQLSTFAYQNGKWDRAERTFFGFATVTEQQLDTAQAGQPVIRSIIETFRTDSFYTKGLLAQQVTQDGAGRRFLETDHTYNVVTVNNHTGVAGLENFTETRFPQLVQTNKLFFEGQPTAGEQTTETFVYDDCTGATPCFGNVIQYTDFGDAGTADDVFSHIGYTSCPATYIVGIANSVTVTDASGNVLRQRQSDVDCTTGNVTENRRFLTPGGAAAVTDMTYDPEGKLTTVTGPANLNGERYNLAYTYDATVDVYVESVTDSFGYVSNSTHDFRFGEVATSTDENGQPITNIYDNFGRLIHVTGPYQQVATGKPTTIDITYPDTLVPPPPATPPAPPLPIPSAKTSHIDTLLDPQLAAGTNHIETVLFTDGLKRVLQTKKEASAVNPPPAAGGAIGTPAHVMTVSGRVAFDAFGRTIAQFYPVTDAVTNDRMFNPAFDAVRPTKMAYDILDRVTQVQIPDDIVALNTGYDTASTTYDFGADRSGQTRFRTTVIDFNGVRSEQYHDVRSQIVTVNEFNNNAATAFHTSYAYDPVRQITNVTDDQGNVTSVAYDLFGRRTAIDSPDAGRTTFSYDLADNLTAKQTANLRATAQQVTFAYQFNRVTAINYPAFPANNVTYTYGAASQRSPSASGNVVGRITHITDGAGTEDRLYGPLGEIVRETRAIPIQGGQVPTYTTKYTYDTWNRIAQMVYPDQPTGEVVQYFYDSGGLVNRVHGNDDQLEVNYASAIAYDKFGQRLSMTNGNGVITTYAYRPDNRRLANVQATLPTGSIFHNFFFTYDAVGNLTQLQNQAQPIGAGANAIGGPWTKTYPNLRSLG
jgi:YD repeat-containing protein